MMHVTYERQFPLSALSLHLAWGPLPHLREEPSRQRSHQGKRYSSSRAVTAAEQVHAQRIARLFPYYLVAFLICIICVVLEWFSSFTSYSPPCSSMALPHGALFTYAFPSRPSSCRIFIVNIAFFHSNIHNSVQKKAAEASFALLHKSRNPNFNHSTMSLRTKSGRITVKPFARVPALRGLPEIKRAGGSVSSVSSRHGIDGGVDLAEGCLITRSIKYTHRLAHWVNAVRSGDSTGIVSAPRVQLVPATKSSEGKLD